jgi:putative transposase
MSRGPRQIHPGHLTEITLKTFQARFLLAPNRLLNRLVLGILARAQARYDALVICAVVVMSNHIHLLVVPECEEQLMRFCQYIGSNISREVGTLRRWTGGIFRRRYSDVVTTHETAAQVGRLKYLLSHGVKEALVCRPQDWPGVNCVKALLFGSMKLEGDWVDRSALYEANRKASRKGTRRGKRPRVADHTKRQVLVLSKIPAWKHLSDEEYRARIAELLDQIHDEYAEERAQASRRGRALVVEDPARPPAKTKRAPKPTCHAASRAERARFERLRREFVRAYLEASALLREGARRALDLFPEGAFLPPLGLTRLRDAAPLGAPG